MQFSKNADFFKVFLHLLFSVSVLFLYYVGSQSEPYALALIYAVGTTGMSVFPVAVLHFFSALFWGNSTTLLLYLAQSALMITGFLIQNRLKRNKLAKSNLIPLLCLSACLGGFIAFAPFTPYALPFSLNTLSQKAILSAFIFLLSACFSVALKALLRKLLKCRLHTDEMAFSLLLCVLIGIGICRFLSVNAYLGMAFFILLVFAYVTKDASPLACAFVLSLPAYFTAKLPISYFFLYGIAIVAFIKLGRLAAVCAFLTVFFSIGYFNGLYYLSTPFLVESLLSVLLPSLLFIIFPAPLLRDLENKLVFYREKHLSRIAINRNRSTIGEKLFELSSVFREIECTFSALGTNEAEQGAKEYIRGCVMEEVCKNCKEYRSCLRNNIQFELDKVIDAGCLKGRTSLLDLPQPFAQVCLNQSNILNSINRQLQDYKRYMTETENASCARALLAKQAQGVSEILKNLALEQSEPLRIYTDKEKQLNVALLSAGIVCSEMLVYGEEDDLTVSLIVYGKSDVKKIAAVASHLFETSMIISEKIALSQDKYCCILRKKPYFDAAFGIASAKKSNASASGDTHSVIKIDERRFMVALSDGMGSGEYARRISESTISLLESFYRAKMPSELVLSTINKLLSFSKEETFACVDIALVDLNSGNADIVKIGSPYGFILTGSAVKVLEGSSLPLGILDSLHPDTASYSLSENDVLLFLSDGITDAFSTTEDLYEVLKTLPIRNPQQLADELLKQAIHAYGGKPKDDMTAVAVRLFKRIDLV